MNKRALYHLAVPKRVLKERKDMSKRHRSHPEGDLTSQIWDDLSMKIMIVKDYELLNKVKNPQICTDI